MACQDVFNDLLECFHHHGFVVVDFVGRSNGDVLHLHVVVVILLALALVVCALVRFLCWQQRVAVIILAFHSFLFIFIHACR